MEGSAFRGEEKVGLAVAAGLHVALVIAFLVQPERAEVLPEPERVSVTIATDVGLAETAPEPVPAARVGAAPELSDAPPPPAPEATVETLPLPPVTPAPPAPRPEPRPRPTTAPAPSPRPRATNAPAPRASAAPAPRRSAAPARPTRAAAAPSRPAPAASSRSAPAASPARATASRIGADFLPGAGASSSSSETRTPASEIGPSARASLLSQITRELRPHFDPPSGVEVDKLVSVVAFRLNADGSLSGSPRLVRQTGVTDANRAQSGRHGEQALRAVRLAAPFDLPSEHYEAFRSVTINFDASL